MLSSLEQLLQALLLPTQNNAPQGLIYSAYIIDLPSAATDSVTTQLPPGNKWGSDPNQGRWGEFLWS